MNMIRRTSPFDELLSLRQAMDHLFDDSLVRPRMLRTVFTGAEPALDITTTDDELVGGTR